MCVDNFSGLSQLDLKSTQFGVFDVKISLFCKLDLKSMQFGVFDVKITFFFVNLICNQVYLENGETKLAQSLEPQSTFARRNESKSSNSI